MRWEFLIPRKGWWLKISFITATKRRLMVWLTLSAFSGSNLYLFCYVRYVRGEKTNCNDLFLITLWIFVMPSLSHLNRGLSTSYVKKKLFSKSYFLRILSQKFKKKINFKKKLWRNLWTTPSQTVNILFCKRRSQY